MSISEELLAFIEKSPTEFHAVENISKELEQAGFTALSEDERWNVQPGGSYYVTRNDSAVIAFSVPVSFEGIGICASHCDSPYFKIKESPEIRKEAYTVLNVEKYGGMLLAPWFDRPLSVAGRLCTVEDGRVCSHLVDFDQDMLIIPSLAIHMDRTANDGKKLNVQDDMLPLYALRGETSPERAKEEPDAQESPETILQRSAGLAGIDPKEICGYDLYVTNHQKGSIWGPEKEFISAPRLDDLQCVYTTLKGFLAGRKEKALSLYVVFNNEEVGSSTRQGACSTFLFDTLKRIYGALGRDFEQYQIDLAKGFMLSADNAHAVHPCFAGKADPVNRPKIGGGVVLKFAASQSYCTDGASAALFRDICKRAGCRVQVFTNRSDMPGGSTLGNLSNNRVALPTADIGLPQLAMHSPYETAGTSDTEDMVRIAQEFFA